MADSWGGSWGTSWGDSWGAGSSTTDLAATGSGGTTFGGAGVIKVTYAFPYAGSGGTSFDGAAETSLTYDYLYTGAGGVSFAGDGAYSFGYYYTGDGGLIFSGRAFTPRGVGIWDAYKTEIAPGITASGLTPELAASVVKAYYDYKTLQPTCTGTGLKPLMEVS